MTDARPDTAIGDAMTGAAAPSFTMLGAADAVVCEGDVCAVPTPQQRVVAQLDADQI